MSKFGKQDSSSYRPRKKIDTAVDSGLISSAGDSTPVDQIQADVAIDKLALTKDKNARVMDVSAAIAEEQTDVYIIVPPSDVDNSQETYMVRNALVRDYRGASENGTVIRFDLFKKIVDNAIATQDKLLSNVLDVTGSGSQLNNFDLSDMYSIMNGTKHIDQFISTDNSEAPKQDQKAMWMAVGVAFLSMELMNKFNKLKWGAGYGEEELQKLNLESQGDPGDEKTIAAKAALRRQRTMLILKNIVEAVVLFALIHNLSKKQTLLLAVQVTPPSLDPELKEEFTTMTSTMYDNPPADISAMLVGQDNSDELIIEYCMRRIDAEKDRKRFNPWIVYAIAKIRDLNINDLSRSLSGTSDESDRIQQLVVEKHLDTPYKAPTFTKVEQIVKDEQTSSLFTYTEPVTTAQAIANAAGVPNMRLTMKNPISNYIGDPNERLGFDIRDYITAADNYSHEASLTSDYYMGLMTNNKYTAELVCCLLKFLGDDLDFLKSLRNMLNVFQRGIGIRLGDLLHDIVDALFTDIRNRLLTYAVSALSKLLAKAKKPILDWIDRVTREQEYVAFCTPLIDMAYALLGILDEFEQLLRDLLSEILKALLTFELNVSDGVLKLNGTSRYLNIIGILDSIIYALEHGRLCNQSALRPADIHPDAVPIITSLSSEPPQYITKAIDDHQAFNNAIRSSLPHEKAAMITISGFKDPEDPQAKGAVSMTRRNTGQSVMDTIATYAPKCGAFNRTIIFNNGIA